MNQHQQNPIFNNGVSDIFFFHIFFSISCLISSIEAVQQCENRVFFLQNYLLFYCYLFSSITIIAILVRICAGMHSTFPTFFFSIRWKCISVIFSKLKHMIAFFFPSFLLLSRDRNLS